MKNVRRLILPFLTAALLLAGCTKEDLSDCPTEVRLSLDFSYNKWGADKFSEEVTGAELFLYGEDGGLLWRRVLTDQEIASQSVTLDLESQLASYTAVLWANVSEEDYELSGTEQRETMNFALRHTDGVVLERPGHVLNGAVEFETDGSREDVGVTLALRKLTNTIHVVLEGAASGTYASDSGTPYSVQITGSNGAYNYDGSKADSRMLTYLPEYTLGVTGYNQALGADFTVMHLQTGDDMRVTVFSNSQTLYDEPLVPLLMQSDEISTDEDLWRFDEYTLFFDANMVLTAIKVLDWTYIDHSEGGI